MTTLRMSSKGQIVLPAALRRRLGIGPGSTLELQEESDGLRLRVLRPVHTCDLTKLANLSWKIAKWH